MTRKTLVVLSAVFFFVSLATAGCGRTSSTPPQTTIPSKLEANVAIPPGVFAADSTMAKLQQKQAITIGVPYAQQPFGQKGVDGGLTGFDIDIAKLIAQGIFGGTVNDAASKITFVDTVSANRELFLKEGKVDLVVSTYGITDMRKLHVDFAGPYFVSFGDVMVKSDDQTVRSIPDLNNKQVCVKKDSIYAAALRTQAPSATLVQKETLQQCNTAIASGEVSAFANDEVNLAAFVQTATTPMRLLGAHFTTDNYGVGIRKGDDAMRKFVNERLAHVEQTGDWAEAFRSSIGTLGLATPVPPQIAATTDTASTTSTSTSTTSTSSAA